MSPDRQSAYAACLEALRQTDRDRYLSCLLVAEEKRGALAAIYAFNAEIARIRDVIHEALPGEIRIQWWRDLIESEEAGESAANPLAQGLLFAIQDEGLPRQTFLNLLDARIFDLYDDPMDSSGSFEGYAGETASALVQLANLVLAPAEAASLAEACGHAGVAQLVAGTLLLMPLHRHRGQIYVPADLLAATGLTSETFLAGKNREKLDAAIIAFCGFGRDHLQQARKSASGKINPGNIGAFLPVSLVSQVLDRAERTASGLFDTSLQPPQWRRQWRMWRAARSLFF